MNFSTAGLNILSNNTTQLNATYLQNALKLSNHISLVKPLFANSKKKILINRESQTLTQITKEIIDSLPVTSSNSLVLKEVLKKVEGLGDGSTTVVLFSGMLSLSLIKLVDDGFSRSLIAKVLRKIRGRLESIKVEVIIGGVEDSRNIISGVLKDKFLIDLVTSACENVFRYNNLKLENSEGVSNTQSLKKSMSLKESLSIDYQPSNTADKLLSEIEDRIRIVKLPIGMSSQSFCLPGLLFKGSPLTQIKTGKNLKTSIYSCPVEISRTNEKGTLLFQSPEQLLNYAQSEQANIQKITTDCCKNSNLVICTNLEEQFIQHFDSNNILAFEIPSKHDIRRIRNLFTGLISPVLKPLPKENTGSCDEVIGLEFGCDTYTLFHKKDSSVSTIVLKNALQILLDEHERMINKALKVLISHHKKYYLIDGCGYFERCAVDQIEGLLETTDMYDLAVIDVFKNTLNEMVSEIEVTEGIYDLLNVRVKALQYAIDVCCVVLETQDMFAVRDTLDIGKRPDLPRDL